MPVVVGLSHKSWMGEITHMERCTLCMVNRLTIRIRVVIMLLRMMLMLILVRVKQMTKCWSMIPAIPSLLISFSRKL